MLILSCAMMQAEYGTCVHPTITENTESWYMTFAANNLSSGKTILLFKNHRPTVSPRIITINEIIKCIINAVENTSLSFESLLLPSSKVINREVAPDIAAFKNPAIPITPPTTP